ncbi:MAG: histidine phosphatase family protein [Candidatus Peribacteraceae bacterium]|jgi:probable phosphoglycerate mutase|nr:histidine phosphatase family protein [Candidatus Peribacteraceae bacterium]
MLWYDFPLLCAMKPLSILVRHGESALNRSNREAPEIVTGRTDTPLTTFGEAQACEAGRHLAHVPLAIAISSPLIRARRTAELALHQHPHPPSLFICPNFTERSLGGFEGRAMDALRTEHPEYFTDPVRMHWRAHFEQNAPGGENLTQVERRVCDGYALLAGRLPDEHLVIFSHLMALRCLLAQLLSLPREEVPRLVIPNATPIIVERTHPPKLVGAFTIKHLRAQI